MAIQSSTFAIKREGRYGQSLICLERLTLGILWLKRGD